MELQKKKPILRIIVPCYNEEDVLPDSAERLNRTLSVMMEKDLVHSDSTIVFVNDGSMDSTWTIITNLSAQKNLFQGLNLSGNFGHQNALVAGLSSCKGDIFITIDADLQDDVETMEEMVRKYHEGYDLVLGVRNHREHDTFFKRVTADLFYRMISQLGAKSVKHHADYRLMSDRVVSALLMCPERNLYLRSLVLSLGFPCAEVLYTRKVREKGKSKYTVLKMMGLALCGITSFSIKPLRLAGLCSFLLFIGSIICMFYVAYSYFSGKTVSGWTSLISVTLLIGAVLSFLLLIIGEYVGRIYIEVKRRPLYILKDCTWAEVRNHRLEYSENSRETENRE